MAKWLPIEGDKIQLPRRNERCLFSTRICNAWSDFLWCFESCVVLVRDQGGQGGQLHYRMVPLTMDLPTKTGQEDLIAIDAFYLDSGALGNSVRVGAVSASQDPLTQGGPHFLAEEDTGIHLSVRSDKTTWLNKTPWRQDAVLRPLNGVMLEASLEGRSQGELRRASLMGLILHTWSLTPHTPSLIHTVTAEHNQTTKTWPLRGYDNHVSRTSQGPGLTNNFELWDLHPSTDHFLVLKGKPGSPEAGKFIFFQGHGQSQEGPGIAKTYPGYLLGTAYQPDWSWTRLGHILIPSGSTTFTLRPLTGWTPTLHWKSNSGNLRHLHETYTGFLIAHSKSLSSLLVQKNL